MKETELIRASFGRCLVKGQLMDRFYTLFLESHSDIPAFFKDTDFDKQKALLRQGINLAIMFADDNPVGKSGIQRIAESHGRAQLNIPTELYPYWKRAFLKAVAELDPEFSPYLSMLWDQFLQKAIDHIVASA